MMPSSGGGLNEPLLKGDNEMSFANVAGVCKSVDGERITRTVFRASRGNTYTVVEPIEEELYDPKEDKLVALGREAAVGADESLDLGGCFTRGTFHTCLSSRAGALR